MCDNIVEYIEDVEKLNIACKYIKKSTNIIGIDTEFIRKHTYYPILCLVQVVFFDTNIKKNKIFVIDTIKIKNIENFLKILNSTKIKKIFFSFSQDIDAFLYLMKNKKIHNVDDVQIMMEFCSYNTNIGYANCVKKILNISFTKNKALQVSNWERRPLKQEQIDYAVSDVIYLIPMYNYLYKLLVENSNYNYYTNEVKYILKSKNTDELIKHSWKKLKFILHKKSLTYVLLMKELCKWRENKAIEQNKIRHLILTDNSLELLSQHKPTTIKELKSIYSNNLDLINLTKIHKYELLEIINNFVKQNGNLYDNDIFYTTEKGFPDKTLLNDIYKQITQISNKLNISPTRTINKMEIMLLLTKYETKRNILYGWKYDIFKYIFLKKH